MADAEGFDPLARAREALIRAELARSKGRSTPDRCPNCPPEAHVCHHEDEMRAWGDLSDVTYTNEQAAERAVAALAAAGLLRDQPAETPDWLTEILHVVQGFAHREHVRPARLTPAHAVSALEAVPAEVQLAASVGPWRPVEDDQEAP